MNISVVEPIGISHEQFEELRKEFEGKGHTFHYFMDRNEAPEALIERMHEADIVVISNIKLPAAVLSQCPHLKLLSVAFTGLDHIDLAYCDAQGIEVVNAAGYSTTAVSELAVGLMLDLMRQVTRLDGVIRQGQGRGAFLGRELRGKTVGVIGTGAIGCATIKLLEAFGAKVICWSRTRKEGYTYVSLDELLKASDIVTLHTPLTPETRHLIGVDQLSLMKPTALLVNTARGPVCDIEAVANALKEGKIAGAAFDVYEQEPPLPLEHPLLAAPNTLLLPHVAFATREAFDIRAGIVMDTVRRFVA